KILFMYIQRYLESSIIKSLKNNPVVALIGPRQCGKSTLVKHLIKNYPSSIYLDLERTSDLNKLNDAEFFLSAQKGKLICIDETQRKPDIFPLIRSLVDEWEINSAFLILGSASRNLLKQSSETLAGRIVYKKLSPFLWEELNDNYSFEQYFSQGAFPRSLLATDAEMSFEWRESFISTFLERDLLQWRGFTPVTMHRLWQMLAHHNGQTVDYSTLAKSLSISSVTVKNYIDLLEGTFMIDVIPSYTSNLGKRLVKSPKIYISDSGITSALLGLRNFNEMIGHPSFGSIWEQIVLSNMKGMFPDASFYFYRTSNGAEVDFVMKWRNNIFAIECKSSSSPSLSKGNYIAFEDIAPKNIFVVAPVNSGWTLKKNIEVVNLKELKIKINEKSLI
ncbi:MAG TPA: ATP-binding protein, partial [Bacteroidales bacterium]|nr:ATP-binding protein [Bacteroidales bacterium]